MFNQTWLLEVESGFLDAPSPVALLGLVIASGISHPQIAFVIKNLIRGSPNTIFERSVPTSQGPGRGTARCQISRALVRALWGPFGVDLAPNKLHMGPVGTCWAEIAPNRLSMCPSGPRKEEAGPGPQKETRAQDQGGPQPQEGGPEPLAQGRGARTLGPRKGAQGARWPRAQGTQGPRALVYFSSVIFSILLVSISGC